MYLVDFIRYGLNADQFRSLVMSCMVWKWLCPASRVFGIVFGKSLKKRHCVHVVVCSLLRVHVVQLSFNIITDASRKKLVEAARGLKKEQNVDCVILGCTGCCFRCFSLLHS